MASEMNDVLEFVKARYPNARVAHVGGGCEVIRVDVSDTEYWSLTDELSVPEVVEGLCGDGYPVNWQVGKTRYCGSPEIWDDVEDVEGTYAEFKSAVEALAHIAWNEEIPEYKSVLVKG